MKPKKSSKKFAWNPKNQTLYRLMSSTPGVILINWAFQGMLGMDRSELIFHLAVDILFTILFCSFFNEFFGFCSTLFFSFVLAHTVNWIFNTHFWVMGRYIGISETNEEKVRKYLSEIHDSVRKRPYIDGVIVFGKMTRGGKIQPTSDVDIRFISKNGPMNRLRTNAYGVWQKTKAFFKKFPLDLYILDNCNSLDKMREDEIPIIIFDPDDMLKQKYAHRGYQRWQSQSKGVGA